MKPIIGITMGDAAGVGPEVCVKAFSSGRLGFCRLLFIGDAGIFRMAAESLGLEVDVRRVRTPGKTGMDEGVMDVLDIGGIKPGAFVKGRPTAMCGAASAEFFNAAVNLAAGGGIDAVVTAPLSKKAVSMAGYRFTGHTEILGDIFKKKPAMVFVCRKIRVALVSRHIPLSRVAGFINPRLIVDTVKIVDDAKEDLGLKQISFALLSLNPHAGEESLLGREEQTKIIPAVRMLEAMGINAEGPFAADGFFGSGRHLNYDFTVAMYHDQGLIPYKMQSFGRGVNLTLGLPIVRTSVDHGTGYDIAWSGRAGEGSMVAAVKLASEIAARRKNPGARV